MTAELRQRLQILLALAVVVAGARVAYIFYERHESDAELAKKNRPLELDPDYYVIPKKLHPYDLKSARELTKQPVWAKVGYAYTCYPYNKASRTVDFSRESGRVLPIEQLQIKDVILATSPRAPGAKQVMVVFDKDDRSNAFSIGSFENGDYHIYSDEMLFIEDPHQLYRHWPPQIWDAIDKHQVIAGMNELQTDFAIGIGYPEGSAPMGNRTIKYPNGGSPLVVTFENDRATHISSGS